nr:uncharacterized protein LOC123772906 [Procambarus clarkii]XP_045622284.1 uncharacterized protein LOC123772906 [Procambarus clarkii]
MRSFIVMMVLMVTGVKALLLLAGALGGLAALKGAALIGYTAALHKAQKYEFLYNKHRFGRSLEGARDAGEELLSAVGKLDTEGCILKLLCYLQIKEKSLLSQEESVLIDLFANITETHYNVAFIRAADIGAKAQDIHECDKHFYMCPLIPEQLSSLLQQAWGCDSYLIATRQKQHIIARRNI